MSELTPRLKLPLIQAAQAQKHVTHNESIDALDVLVQLSVISDSITVPPSDPDHDARYIVPASAQGEWEGKTHLLAVFVNGGWVYYTPNAGWVAYVLSSGQLTAFNGTEWSAIAAQALSTAEMLGINATASTHDRLTVSSPSTLFNHEGTGHQLKINKASSSATGSVVFQTGFSGQAEIGLAGDDALSFKTNTNAQGWVTGLALDKATGAIRAPSGGVRETALAPMELYVAPDGSDAAKGDMGAPLATLAEALRRIASKDHLNVAATIMMHEGSHTIGAIERWPSTIPGLPGIVITTSPSATNQATLDLSSANLTIDSGDITIQNIRLANAPTGEAAITAKRSASVKVINCHFTNPGKACVIADGGMVEITSLTLTGSTERIFKAQAHGVIDARGAEITLTGTPHFAIAGFEAELLGLIDLNTALITGTATGKTAQLSGNAVLNSGGLTLPGDSPATITSGAQFL